MKTINVLFIGNSYTAHNNLPYMVSQLALSSKEPEEAFAQAITRSEATLEWHCERRKALKMIEEKRWNFVVLQEHSTRPVEDKIKMYEYAEILNSEIKKTGAKTVLYLTWTRQDSPEMQEKLTEAYVNLSKKIGARVSPVGEAWAHALKANPELVLYDEDKSHPTPTGTYLAACVFYSMFFGHSPAGLTGNIYVNPVRSGPLEADYDTSNRVNTDINLNLPEDTAGFLQSIAWKTVKEFDKQSS